MPSLRFICVHLCSSVAALFLLGATPTWELAPNTPTGLDLFHSRSPSLTFSLSAWGPGYKWFEYPGPATSSASSRTLDQSSPIPGTPARLNLTFTTNQTSPTTTTLTYTLAPSEPIDLTGLAATLHPAPGTTLTATYADTSHSSLPVDKSGDLPSPLRSLTITTATDSCTLDINPPLRAETFSGELRLWLAKSHLNAAPITATLTLTTPTPSKFYPRDSDAAVSDITPDWFPYPVAIAGTPVDLSFLNKDPQGHFIPAGSHGFVQVKGDQFVFADGTPARFWGVNLTAYAALGSYQRSAQLADRLSRLGINLVRLHHLDSWGPNLIDLKSPDNTTQHLDENNMARLDRLIYELKIRGIYVLLDPWVGRSYRPGDNVPGSDKFEKGNFGLAPYIFFDPHMRDLDKLFLKQVWTHTNSFTHLPYNNDPAIALTECANEALFNLPSDIAEPYRTEIVQLYTRWCAANHLDPGDPSSIYKLNYPVQHQRFFQYIMHDFYTDIRHYMKTDLQLKIPINSSNWFHWPWEIGAQADADFMDSHYYYHGNRIGPTSSMGGLWTQNPLENPDSPYAPIAALAIYGKPLISSECGDNPPQTYRSSYYLGLAAVACLQGWDGLTPFAYSQAAEPPGHLESFEMESDPATIASLAAGALIYRRGDVSPAKESAVMLLPDDEQFAMHWEDNYAKAFDHTAEFRAMSEIHHLSVVYGDKLPDGAPTPIITMTPATAYAYKHIGTQLLSDTHELWRDWSLGIGLINTPRTQAAYGLLSRTPISTSDVTFTISTPFAACSLSSLTNDPIKSSPHLLLIT
ncbi:MAG TPA: hypothetical protein VFE58_09930, partial [Tepidisphaeraceae bacterium]|nr:hypothetical protein [Tepidisphaeraceae bacterium]